MILDYFQLKKGYILDSRNGYNSIGLFYDPFYHPPGKSNLITYKSNSTPLFNIFNPALNKQSLFVPKCQKTVNTFWKVNQKWLTYCLWTLSWDRKKKKQELKSLSKVVNFIRPTESLSPPHSAPNTNIQTHSDDISTVVSGSLSWPRV